MPGAASGSDPRAPGAAFDAAAATYDAGFSHRTLGRWLREIVHEKLDASFPAGAHVLELGCGTGEDALHLARRGVRVVATDASARMLAVAAEKVRSAGAVDRVRLLRFDMARTGETESAESVGSEPAAGIGLETAAGIGSEGRAGGDAENAADRDAKSAADRDAEG
ncbi:MAG TPA: class I SAM-dependent methyltransferase, partial [Longimicrobiaceae bacterium]|nr:class I SAM-dependent methyltransferase [Longimicrobiaceae bacterium]